VSSLSLLDSLVNNKPIPLDLSRAPAVKTF
jgi:hypothetical protein